MTKFFPLEALTGHKRAYPRICRTTATPLFAGKPASTHLFWVGRVRDIVDVDHQQCPVMPVKSNSRQHIIKY
jgi:hypothetical protein